MKHLTIAALLACAAANAQAAPFATTYTGEIDASSDFPGAQAGEPYSVTLVFDNGGSSAASQTWATSQITCAIWRFNTAQDMVFTQPMAPGALASQSGTATTDATGTLDGFFSVLFMVAPAGSYTASGINPPMDEVRWSMNSSPANPVFFDFTRAIRSTQGGISLAPANWSAPAPFTGTCALPTAAAPNATPVPTLGHAALALLSGVLGAAGFIRRRKD